VFQNIDFLWLVEWLYDHKLSTNQFLGFSLSYCFFLFENLTKRFLEFTRKTFQGDKMPFDRDLRLIFCFDGLVTYLLEIKFCGEENYYWLENLRSLRWNWWKFRLALTTCLLKIIFMLFHSEKDSSSFKTTSVTSLPLFYVQIWKNIVKSFLKTKDIRKKLFEVEEPTFWIFKNIKVIHSWTMLN